MGPAIHQWRTSVRNDVVSLVAELAEEQEEWLGSASPRVQQVYRQGSSQFVVQLLAMANLLQLFAFPEHSELITELYHGFPLLVPLPPGA